MHVSPATLFMLELHSNSPALSFVPPPSAPNTSTSSTTPAHDNRPVSPSPTPQHYLNSSVIQPLLPIIPPSHTLRILSSAPFADPYIPNEPFLPSAEQFFEDNHLIAATLKPHTQQKYAIALHNFALSTAASDDTPLSLDQRLCLYIHETYLTDSRPGQRQEMSNLLCMLLIMYPHLRQQLGLARRSVSGWKTLTPARAAAPLTRQLVHAFAWHLLSAKRPQAATILLLTFSGCLRVSEALQLTWEHVALPGDTRLSAYQPGLAGINIVDAKTARYSGELQFVKLSDPDIVKFLCTLHARPHRLHDTVANISYQTYTHHLKATASQFGFSNHIFTSHSARIGKATEDFIQGIPVDDIAVHGRWKSLNSLRYYINNGRAWLLKNNVSSVHQADIKLAAQYFKTLLDNSPPTP